MDSLRAVSGAAVAAAAVAAAAVAAAAVAAVAAAAVAAAAVLVAAESAVAAAAAIRCSVVFIFHMHASLLGCMRSWLLGVSSQQRLSLRCGCFMSLSACRMRGHYLYGPQRGRGGAPRGAPQRQGCCSNRDRDAADFAAGPAAARRGAVAHGIETLKEIGDCLLSVLSLAFRLKHPRGPPDSPYTLCTGRGPF